MELDQPLLFNGFGAHLVGNDSPKFGSVKFLFRFKDDGDVTVKNGGSVRKSGFRPWVKGRKLLVII